MEMENIFKQTLPTVTNPFEMSP